MAISRQSDSIWVESAMGYGRQHSPASEDHYGAGKAHREYGEALGRKHAHESIDKYHRDEKGRFAPMPHHKKEHDSEAHKISDTEHRDKFKEGYHKGFHSAIREHEEREKAKANKHSSAGQKIAVRVDPHTGELFLDEDPGLFAHRLKNGGSAEGYEPPSWLDSMMSGSQDSDPQWQARHPTEKDPYRYDTDTIKNVINHKQHGLGLGMSDKAPFSNRDVGLGTDRKYAKLRPGELASRPIQVTDHLGNVHTFVHQITAPNLNPGESDDPEDPGKWVVSLHHHIRRPDGSSEWLPSEVSEHRGGQYGGSKARPSNRLYPDIIGQLHANSDMVTMYGAGAQRVGDKMKSIEYEFPHPAGDVVYRVKLANGYNPRNGFYYNPDLAEDHEDRQGLKGDTRWIVTGRGLDWEHAHDSKSPARMSIIEGSDRPDSQMISYKLDDIPGVIDHIWKGLGAGSRGKPQRIYPQNQLPNTGGRPLEEMVRKSSLPPWSPDHNIHRRRERLPIESF